MKKLLENKWYKQFFKNNKLTVEDLMKPFIAKKILFEDENLREEQKLQGRFCPFSFSGSKSKQINKDAVTRFKDVFLNKHTFFDNESKNRMKFGTIAEELVLTQIVPDNLINGSEAEKTFWENKILVLDKRRYFHPIYEWISVEYDVLVFDTPKSIQTVDTIIYNPKTQEDYDLLDKNWADGTWVPYMILDLKITKNSIEQNTKDYKEQLTTGCWMLPEFKKHSILAFIENAKIEYWISKYNKKFMEEIFNKYTLYLDNLVIPTLNKLEDTLDNEVSVDEIIQEYNDIMILLKFFDSDINNESLSQDKKNLISALLNEAIQYKNEASIFSLKYDMIIEKIKNFNIPVHEVPNFIETNDFGRLSWVKFKRSGESKFSIKDYNNYLEINDTSGILIMTNNKTGEKVEVPLETFITSGKESVSEFARFTKNAQTKEIEQLIKLKYQE